MNTKTKEITLIALFAAIFSLIGPIAIPIGPIPISLTNFIIYIGAYILTPYQLTASFIIYLALGIAGLPVFSGYGSGIPKLLSPTGGYIIGLLFSAVISSTVVNKFYSNKLISLFGMLAGLIITYLFGTLWFYIISSQKGIYYILISCIIPFIPFDIAKIAVASYIGSTISKRLKF